MSSLYPRNRNFFPSLKHTNSSRAIEWRIVLVRKIEEFVKERIAESSLARRMNLRYLLLATSYSIFIRSCFFPWQAVAREKTALRHLPTFRRFRANTIAHTDGECCPFADVQSRRACRFLKSRDLLINAREPRPSEFGGPCLAFERMYRPHVTPEYSVLISSFNAAERIRIVVTQLLKLTHGNWELVFLCDACDDDSLAVVRSVLERSRNWQMCPYEESDIDQGAVWQTGVNLTSYQGDIGRECNLTQKGVLTRASAIDVKGAELLESAANNVLMLAARAPFLILLQDDQLMTQPGWNVALTMPLTLWPDVFSVSARCAHCFDIGNQGGILTGAKCVSTLTQQPVSKESRCRFFVRDSGNRGPLAVRASYAQRIGFLDETRHVEGGDDDHEMNLRAYARHRWVSGHAPIDYTEERCCRSPPKYRHGALTERYREWLKSRLAGLQSDATRGAYGPGAGAFVQNGHDQDRAIESPLFWKGCGAP